jgi:type I restriction enzyme, S subunit
MSQIDDLIQRICPNGVVFKTLGEIGALFGGLSGKSGADFGEAGNARYVSYLNVYRNMATDIRPPELVRVAEGERQTRLRRADVLFTGSSENAHECGLSSVLTAEPPEPLYLNSFCIGFRPNDPGNLEPDFFKHLCVRHHYGVR